MSVKSSGQLYKKLLYICSAVIICVVLALMTYFISSTRLRILDSDMAYAKMLSEDVSNYVKESSEIADYIISDLYKSSIELNDMVSFLQKDPDEYLKDRLNKYIDMRLSAYSGIDDFISDTFQAYQDMTRITVISYTQDWATIFLKGEKATRSHDQKLIMEQVQKNDVAKEGEFSFVKELRDPETWESLGCMIITFDIQKIEELEAYYERANIVMLNSAGTEVIKPEDYHYDSHSLLSKDIKEVEGEMDAYIEQVDVGDYKIFSYLRKQEAGIIPAPTFGIIISLAVGSVIFGEILLRYYLKRLARRLSAILEGMEKVRTGDLSVRLHGNEGGDELDIISENFNEMCKELEQYIQKSYLAEIERKNAELEALQTQINPHFLYNTLEVIRMKAICNGDKEVGKMLYTMAVIFRSQIKEADVITLVQELHYCKKYLELFEYRYQSQFISQVECPEEYMQVPVIKFILQPILENYFIHGMRRDANDNFIYIGVKKLEEDMLIFVEDNGKGMSDSAIEEKNQELWENNMNSKKSIGISNVNRRVKAVYGAEYGVWLEHSPSGGVRVNVKFKVDERKDT